jgi:D-sedoheptulose 7-phosphate isomerase
MDQRIDPVSRGLLDSHRTMGLAIQDMSLLESCQRAADALVDALASGDRIWFCGNGGSAAEAQHLAAELSGRFTLDRNPLPAEALHVNTSTLTAVANDYGYDQVFSRLVAGSARPGDVLVCLTTSGCSANVVAAARQARTQGVVTIGLTGPGGGSLAAVADLLICAPPDVTATSRIQELHLAIGHTLCEIVEQRLFTSPHDLMETDTAPPPQQRSRDQDRDDPPVAIPTSSGRR